MVICLEQSANDLRMVRIQLPPHHLCHSKIQNVLSFWYRPTQVVLEKRPLNGCVCVCVCKSGISRVVWDENGVYLMNLDKI